MDDCLILGGGVVGLSLAYELAAVGLKVHLIDRAAPGQEASWAGAGILPPGNPRAARTPDDQIAGLAYELHPQWSERLREETGIDNGYRRCGGLYLATDAQGEQELQWHGDYWRALEVSAERLSSAEVAQLEPALAPNGKSSTIRSALWLREEAQLRNPRHLKALEAGCRQRGVRISADTTAEGFDVRGGRVHAVRTSNGLLSAETVCVAGGAWSGDLLVQLGVSAALRPIRGQMVLLACPRPPIERVVNVGRRYLVPRDDGRVLVGSTEEDAGFQKCTTAEGVAGLLRFALELAPTLSDAVVERTWAGLRPETPDGRPYIGRIPGLDNAFVATGHFRQGLLLSPATAVVLGQLMRGETPQVALDEFRADRNVGRSGGRP
jgi:glycine oxidase